MKITKLARQCVLTSLAFYIAGCSGGTNTGIPPYGTTLAFEDKSKGNMLLENKMQIERVDLKDSTQIIDSRSAKMAVNYYGSDKYGCLFMIGGGLTTDTLVVRGWNKFRIVYTGKKEVDWLEFYARSSEGPVPEQVKFNGKVIPRQDSNEPVEQSYLYVLK